MFSGWMISQRIPWNLTWLPIIVLPGLPGKVSLYRYDSSMLEMKNVSPMSGFTLFTAMASGKFADDARHHAAGVGCKKVKTAKTTTPIALPKAISRSSCHSHKEFNYFLLPFLLVMEAKAMEHATKYQFGVRWALNGLSSGVEVHDILLSFSGSPRHVDCMLPLSHDIRTGRNSVQLSAWPVPFEENHELLLSLMYWEPGDNPNTEANTAFEVVMRPGLDNPAPELTFVDENAPLRALANEIRWLDRESYFTLDVPFINLQPMTTWCCEQVDVWQVNVA